MRRLAALLLTTATLAACGQSEGSQDPLQVAETLEAAKPAYESRIFGPDRVKIQGKLVGLIRRYH